MKIGIMSFAHLHAEAYIQNLRALPNVEMMGIADEDLVRGQRFAEQFDVPIFPSYEAMLAEKPDGVIVCSENSKRRSLVEMAANAGVHVLSEKPLATNLPDAEAMIDVCRRAGVILMTAFPMRFSVPVLKMKSALDAGKLGKIYGFNATNQGQMPIAHREWFVDKTLAGGGAMTDHIVHLADVLRWILHSEVTEVYAQSNRILHADKVDVETGALVMLTFADGTVVSIDSSWSKPLNYPTWGGLTMEIISERGLTVLDAFSQNLNIYQAHKNNHRWEYWGSDANQAMIAEFVAAIGEARAPAITGEDGLKALQIVLAAYQSVKMGQPVKL